MIRLFKKLEFYVITFWIVVIIFIMIQHHRNNHFSQDSDAPISKDKVVTKEITA